MTGGKPAGPGAARGGPFQQRARSRVLWLTAALLWCLLLYHFSAHPAYTGPQTLALLRRLGGLADPSLLPLLNRLIRKAAHLTVYAALALAFWSWWRRRVLHRPAG